MKKLGKVLVAMAMAMTLFGCGGGEQASANKDQFVVGMECSYAPFNWQTSQESDTTVSIGLKEGTRDSEFFKQVQASLDKITVDERKQLMTEAVDRQPAGE